MTTPRTAHDGETDSAGARAVSQPEQRSIAGVGGGSARESVVCPAHGVPMVRRESRWGPFWGCPDWPACDYRVGAHPDGSPLGTPADEATRRARVLAHAAFDPLWNTYPRGAARRKQRRVMYGRLQRVLGLGHIDECHIALFDKETCEKVVEACATWRREEGSIA